MKVKNISFNILKIFSVFFSLSLSINKVKRLQNIWHCKVSPSMLNVVLKIILSRISLFSNSNKSKKVASVFNVAFNPVPVNGK